jgi:hypothetical protein
MENTAYLNILNKSILEFARKFDIFHYFSYFNNLFFDIAFSNYLIIINYNSKVRNKKIRNLN